MEKVWEEEEGFTRVSLPDDSYEYQVEINGKTVTCTGLNSGFMDGINHSVECKFK